MRKTEFLRLKKKPSPGKTSGEGWSLLKRRFNRSCCPRSYEPALAETSRFVPAKGLKNWGATCGTNPELRFVWDAW